MSTALLELGEIARVTSSAERLLAQRRLVYLEPTTGGFNQLNEFARDVDSFIGSFARELDMPAPAPELTSNECHAGGCRLR